MMGSMASSGTATSPLPLLGLVNIKLPPWIQGEIETRPLQTAERR
jgi:hypothetical protein